MTAPDRPPSAVPRRALSVRATLVLASGVAFAFVLLAGAALSFRVLPSAGSIASRGRAASVDYTARTTLAARLDSALTDLWIQMTLARTGPLALDSLAVRRVRIESFARETELLAPLRRDDAISTELSRSLEEADNAASVMAAALLGVVGALEVRDLPTAEVLIRRADALDAPLALRLNDVTRAALADLARDEAQLERDARFATRLVSAWILLGFIFAPLLWSLLARRLFQPLAAFDEALEQVERGELDVDLPAPFDDELGRLAQHFNRTTQQLRVQRAAGEQAAAQAALEASEARYRAAFEEAAVGLAEIGLDGVYMRINRTMCAVLGRPPEEIIGHGFREFTHPDDAALDRENWPRLFVGNGEFVRVEKRYVRADGRTTIAQVTGTLLRHPDGSPRHVLTVVQDVTDQHRLERELLQSMKLEAVGQLAGGVAHDFNNLLAGIIGYAELLEQDESHPEAVREDAASIRRAALRGADLSRSLLTLARQNPHRQEPVAIDAIAHETVELFRRTSDRRIEVTLDAASGATVLGDRSLLSNALLNLALNARDAMPDGGALRVSARSAAPDATFRARHGLSETAPLVAIEVADTGVGMSPEVLEHVFEPFFTTKDSGRGTGLGLALVYGTVKDHGGAITIDSALGRGTAMTIHLPCIESDVPHAEESSAPTPAAAATRVLLVDDDPLVREVCARMLRRLGYDVVLADDGLEALALLERDAAPIGAVILDGNMPRLSGIETARRIRERWPLLPLVYASGYVDPAAREELDALRFRARLSKPYSVEALSHAVADCFASTTIAT